VIRAYTPSSPIDQAGYFDLVIKTYEFGKMSSYLHSLEVGQEVEVRGPVGRFKYVPNAHRFVGLIAGGTGLTPCLQVIRTVLTSMTDDHTNFILFFQNRAEEDILLQEELQGLQAKHTQRLQVLYFLSNPSTTFGNIPGEVRGYVSTELVVQHMPPGQCSLVGLCGPSGFNDYIKARLKEAGHQDDNVFVW
jgi:cytochrome-b5 reductase